MEEKNSRILVTRSSLPPFEEFTEAIKPIWESAWLTNFGANHEKLREELINYMQVENVSLFVNGHSALELCLQAMELEGEVITTPFTFVSTTHAIIRNGLTPVFCDIDPENYTLDPRKLEALITEKTCAIVPVHVYGNICNFREIQRIAKKNNLKVIYDAAHTFGVKIEGEGVGNLGDASMFSFHATKVFHTIEGGAIVTKDKDLYEKLHRLKDFGILDEETIDSVGANAKMNEFQAAMGLCNLKYVDREIAKRKAVVQRYREHLESIHGVKVMKEVPGVESNYAYFPIVFEEEFGESRDDVFQRLKENNIHSRKYFYPLTNTLACFEGRFNPEKTPIALDISKRVLTLPLFADLPLEDVDRICGIIINKR